MSEITMCKVATYAQISKLKLHPENPREISPERMEDLKESIKTKGFYQPILVWKKNGVVLAGNHRLMAAKQLIEEGFEFVSPKGEKNVLPIVVEDMDADRAKAILFETNNSYADWIDEKLRAAVKGVEEGVLSSWGFTMAGVDSLLSKALEDAEKIVDKAEQDEKLRDRKESKGEDEKEAMEYLALPSHVHGQLTDMLGEIAQLLNDSWMPGNSYTEAVQVLCQAIKESDFMGNIRDSLLDKEEPVTEADWKKKSKAKKH